MAIEKDAREKLQRTSLLLTRAFGGILCLYIAFVVAFIIVSLIGFEGDASHGIASIVPSLVSFALGGFAIYVMHALFKDMSKGSSPFTSKQAARLLVLGVLLLAGVVFEGWASITGVAFSSEVAMNGVDNWAASGTTVVRFNATMLFSAIGCFCLSYVFKYGSLLQWLYDETV